MTNNNMPFVAIVGGIWKLDAATANEARKTGQEIGRALALAGMGLVVYFSDDPSLEPHVVTGYVNALSPGVGAKSIRVRYAKPQKGKVKFAEESTRGDVFDPHVFPVDDWEAPFYQSLLRSELVDAVLLMAGATSTLIAGLIAMEIRLPVLAIDKFDGSASTIHSELARLDHGYPSSVTHTIEQSVTWLKNNWEEKVKLREKQKEEQEKKQEEFRQMQNKYSKMIAGKKKTVWAAGAFITLLVAVFLGMYGAPDPGYYSILMFGALIAAGAMGALIRSIIWKTEDVSSARSLLLGAVAGFVVGIAYLIPQWIGAPGVLESSTNSVTPADKIQFVSAILIAISAGLGFDSVFNRLKKQADEQPISPPGK